MLSQKNMTGMPREVTKIQVQNLQSGFTLSAEEKLSVMEALDHILVTRQYQEMGSCTVCKKISSKKCSLCGTFYCSSECQTYDWPKHKIVCSRQRENTSDRNSSNMYTHADSFKNLNIENLIVADRSSPFAVLANQLNKKSGKDYNGSKSLTNYKIGNKQYQNKEQVFSKSREGLENLLTGDARDYKKINTFDKKKSSPKKTSNNMKKEECITSGKLEEKKGSATQKNSMKSQKNGGRTVKNSAESIPAEHFGDKKSQPKLSKIGKMNVIGTYRESPERCWVMDVNNLRKYEEIQNQLNMSSEGFTEVIPKVGLLCSCNFADEWFRGKIISISPEIIVHFIDFGNTSNYDHNVFRKLPNGLHSIPALAFQIEFDESTSVRFKTADLDSIKFVIEETGASPDGVPRVKVIEGINEIDGMAQENVPLSKKSQEITFKENRSVMDTITSSTKGMIIMIPGEEKTRYGSLIPDGNEDAQDCVERVLNIENLNNSPIEAEEGDYVLVIDREGNDQRGKVLACVGSTYFVQLVDCGNVISTDCVYPLSESLKGLIELGVKITIEEVIAESQMKSLESSFFVIAGEQKAGKWPCILKGTDYEMFAAVSLEKPSKIISWQPKYVFMKSGATVEISSSTPPNSFYIRAVDVETEQKFLDMNMELMQFVPKAKGFAIPPSPGDLCCAKFLEDGCFYRGIVNSFERGKANILFIDFGNEQETDLEDIKQLSPSLKNFPCFAVKVKLKNVSRKPWNNMIKDYIGKLTSENIELTLIYDGRIKDGVILKEKVSGMVVNEFIEKVKDRRISQSTKSGSDLSSKTEIFLDDDLKYTTVSPGTKCDLAVLYVSEDEFITKYTFWATVAGVKNFNYVNFDLNSLITEHCTHISTPYEPSYRELCLAEYEGSWYRAICAGKDAKSFTVVFVDFGNVCVLKATSIRKMAKKFMSAPALAMNCTINGFERLNNRPELTKKVFSLLLERVNTCFEGVEVITFEEDTFLLKIPEIEKLLSD